MPTCRSIDRIPLRPTLRRFLQTSRILRVFSSCYPSTSYVILPTNCNRYDGDAAAPKQDQTLSRTKAIDVPENAAPVVTSSEPVNNIPTTVTQSYAEPEEEPLVIDTYEQPQDLEEQHDELPDWGNGQQNEYEESAMEPEPQSIGIKEDG